MRGLAQKLMGLQQPAGDPVDTSQIMYLGGTSTAANGTTPISVDLTGFGLQEGDLVVVGVNLANNDVREPVINSAGYTTVVSLHGEASYETNLLVAYKEMGSNPDTSVEIAGAGRVLESQAAVVRVYRYTHPFVFRSNPPTVTFSGSHTADPPVISPLQQGSAILVFGATAHVRGVETYSSTDLDDFETAGENSNYDATIGSGHIMDWQSGDVDPAPFVFSDTTDSNSYSYAAVTLELFPPEAAVTENTGWLRFDTATQSGSGADWTDAIEALDDTDEAYAQVSAGNVSKALVAKGVTHSIPSSASVTGIEFSMKHRDNGGNITEEELRLVVDGTASGTDKATGVTWRNTVESASPEKVFGGDADTWGLSLSPSDIDADFGVSLIVTNTGSKDRTGRVRDFKIRIHYTG